MRKPLKIKNSKLTERQIKMGLVFFVAGTSAETAAELIGIHRNSAARFYDYLHRILAKYMAGKSPFLEDEIEVDKSYFGGVRKGKRGRVQPEKFQYSVYEKEMDGFMRR